MSNFRIFLIDESKPEASKEQQHQHVFVVHEKKGSTGVKSIIDEEEPSVDVVTTDEPKAYVSSMQSIIERLAGRVQLVSDEVQLATENDSECREKEHGLNLLDFLKTLKEE